MNETIRLDTQEDLDRALAMGMTSAVRQALATEFGADAIRHWGRTVARLATAQLQNSTETNTSAQGVRDGR